MLFLPVFGGLGWVIGMGAGLGLDFLGVRNETKDDLGLGFGAGSMGVGVVPGRGETGIGVVLSKSRTRLRASVRFSEKSKPCRLSNKYRSNFSTECRYRSNWVTRPWKIAYMSGRDFSSMLVAGKDRVSYVRSSFIR